MSHCFFSKKNVINVLVILTVVGMNFGNNFPAIISFPIKQPSTDLYCAVT